MLILNDSGRLVRAGMILLTGAMVAGCEADPTGPLTPVEPLNSKACQLEPALPASAVARVTPESFRTLIEHAHERLTLSTGNARLRSDLALALIHLYHPEEPCEMVQEARDALEIIPPETLSSPDRAAIQLTIDIAEAYLGIS